MKVLKITPERCTGCLRCELACSYMQVGDYQPAKSVIRVSPFEGHTSYAPYTCTQCAEGWCMTACPVGAITINAAGAKDVIDDKCVGCKLCTIACAYGTMFFMPETRKAFKCNLCGGDPACAAACVARAGVAQEAVGALARAAAAQVGDVVGRGPVEVAHGQRHGRGARERQERDDRREGHAVTLRTFTG